MKGSDKLVAALNARLADELTAINQYMVHSEMCENWGYHKLQEAIKKQAVDEMHHAEWLIERIIHFDTTPTVSVIHPVKIGKSVFEIIDNDNSGEQDAVRAYNDTIKLAREVNDEGTVDLLLKILKMEEGHVSWAETQSEQIKQMGIENFLANQE